MTDAPAARGFRRPGVKSQGVEDLEEREEHMCVQLESIQASNKDSESSASAGDQSDREGEEMPGEAQDGDTEGRNRDEKRESEESEGLSDVSRKRNNDGEVEAGYENVKDFGIKYDWVDIEEVGEEDDDLEDDDDNEYGDSDGENYWINRTQKKRSEEEKEYMWISVIDRKTYLKVMTPQYLLLEVRSTLPLQVQHVRMAVTHLSK